MTRPLKINSRQIAAFQAERTRSFTARVIEFLRTEFPEAKDISTGILENELQPLINRAGEYGLHTEIEVVGYLIAAKYLGWDFDAVLPPVKRVLTSQHLTGTEKAEWLENFVTLVDAKVNRA